MHVKILAFLPYLFVTMQEGIPNTFIIYFEGKNAINIRKFELKMELVILKKI